MTDKAKIIFSKLLNCSSIQELELCCKEHKNLFSKGPDKDKLNEIKFGLNEYLKNRDLEVYKSSFSDEDCRRIENELRLPLSKKKRLNELRMKKLKYYGRI